MRILGRTGRVIACLAISLSANLYGKESQICSTAQQKSKIKTLEVDGVTFCNEYSFLKETYDSEKVVRRLSPEFMHSELAKFLPKQPAGNCSKNSECLASFMLLHAFHSGDYGKLTAVYKDGSARTFTRSLTYTSPNPVNYDVGDFSGEAVLVSAVVKELVRVQSCSERSEASTESELSKIRKITADYDVYCGYFDMLSHGPKTELVRSEDEDLRIYAATQLLFADHLDLSDAADLKGALSAITRHLVSGSYEVLKVEFSSGKTSELSREALFEFWLQFKERI